MTENENRQWSTATDGNQNETSRKLGIPLDVSHAWPANDQPPGILPTNNGSLRAVPTHFVSGPNGNRVAK